VLFSVDATALCRHTGIKMTKGTNKMTKQKIDFEWNMNAIYSYRIAQMVSEMRVPAGKDAPTVIMDRYSNGREQGACFSLYRYDNKSYFWICFSEHRQGDDIVVYVSESKDFPLAEGFDGNRNMPTEEAYENQKCFPGNMAGCRKAASHIKKELRRVLTEVVKNGPR
jgi:hypothetical protein